MEPTIVLQITPRGLVSVQIHSTTDREETAGLKLYERIKPAIRVAEALLLDPPIPEHQTQSAGTQG
jgi:hypothetical protein